MSLENYDILCRGCQIFIVEMSEIGEFKYDENMARRYQN